jgi:hypothetical protein
MGGVDFNEVKACHESPGCCLTKGLDYCVDAALIESLRDGVGGGKCEGAGRDGLPSTFSGQEKTVADLGRSHARLSAGVGQLNAGAGALGVEKCGDARQGGDVRVFPDAEIGW